MGRERIERHRAQLTPEQLASQRLTNSQAMRANRALKSAKQRASQNAANAQRMAAQRASLTPEQLSTQRSRYSQAMVLQRELETDSERILRRHRENVQRHERLLAEQNNLRRLWLIEAETQTITHECGTMNAQCVYCKSLILLRSVHLMGFLKIVATKAKFVCHNERFNIHTMCKAS